MSAAAPYYLLYSAAALLALFLVAVTFRYRRMRRWRVRTGREAMIGEAGVVRSPIIEGAGGMVFVHGERWRAFPEDPKDFPIRTGTGVEIVGFRGNTVIVRPAERHDPTS